ncbi:hypothetical protein Tco_0543331 [Tanacetum coccineum]
MLPSPALLQCNRKQTAREICCKVAKWCQVTGWYSGYDLILKKPCRLVQWLRVNPKNNNTTFTGSSSNENDDGLFLNMAMVTFTTFLVLPNSPCFILICPGLSLNLKKIISLEVVSFLSMSKSGLNLDMARQNREMHSLKDQGVIFILCFGETNKDSFWLETSSVIRLSFRRPVKPCRLVQWLRVNPNNDNTTSTGSSSNENDDATLGLRHTPDSYGRQQWGIFRNGRKPDGAMPRGAAVIQRMQALSVMIGRKASVGGFLSPPSNPRAQLWTGGGNYQAGVRTLPGLDMPRILLKERGAFGNADTGGAWLSSTRATGGDKPEEGEDDVTSGIYADMK